ncbi:MAG: hypothetical protein AAF531_27945 [Actinomycetota bacterium]
MSEGVLTLIGVFVGAGLTMLTTVGLELVRIRRDDNSRWMDQRLEAFAGYIAASKHVVTLARRIQRAVDWEAVDEVRLQELADAELERSMAAEKVVLLTKSQEVLDGLSTVNQAAWLLEKPSRLRERLDRDVYEQHVQGWHAAINSFHLAARLELGIDTTAGGEQESAVEGIGDDPPGSNGLAR